VVDLLEYNAPRQVEGGVPFKSKTEPKHIGEFQLAQTVIPLEGGQHYLRLLKPLTLKVSQNLRCEVQDWGIELDYLAVSSLPREAARRFSFLLTAAENEQLTEKDQADLVKISEYIDFRQFSVDRSPSRYQEGILLSNREKVIVEWHDGKRESLVDKAARALDMVNIGEKFAAYVKLGKNDNTISIDRVSLFGPTSEFSKEDWSAWPKTN
jgi:hypothetical protein